MNRGSLRPAAAAMLLTVMVAAAFRPALDNGFVDLDDWLYVTRNEALLRPLDAGTLAWMLSPGPAGNWHPLTWLSHWIDVRIFGLEPFGHHLHGLLLHLAGVLLLLGTLRRMTGALGATLAAVLIFAVHPLRVESVVWAAERKDVLAFTLGMATIAGYLWHLRRPGRGRFQTVLGLYLLGLMAKPTLVVLPGLLLVLDWWPLGRLTGCGSAPWRRCLAEKAPFVALAALAGVLTLVAQHRGEAIGALATYPAGRRLANAAETVCVYLAKTAWPTGLAAFYPYPDRPADPSRMLAVGAGLVIFSLGVWLLRRRIPSLAAGWTWFLVALLPVVGLIQAGNQARADRYTYLASVGLVLAAAGGGELIRRSRLRRLATLMALLVAAVALTITSRAQVTHWRDDVSLYRRMLDVTPDDAVIANSLGVALGRSGRLSEAEPLFRLAVARAPGSPDGWSNLAKLQDLQGRSPEAVATLRQGIATIPGSAALRNNLALLGAVPGSETAGVTWRAVVVHVDDGDTIRVRRDGGRVVLRLHGIDAPERGQAFADRARKFTAALCNGATVTVREVETDRYGRTVAEVFLSDGRSVNREIVRAGYAWWYRRYTDDPVLARLEEDARRSRAGLWADGDPIPPWEFRRRERDGDAR